MTWFLRMERVKQVVVFGGLALSLLAAASAPMLGGDEAEAAKKSKKARTPNVAVLDISIEPHADPGHKTVVVELANTGKRNASGFRISMVAQREDGTVRQAEYSLPLSVPKGGSTEVEFRLGCSWINNGAVTASTDPNPVSGEPKNKAANNVLSETFGVECVI
jgi:hypothetical protein